MLYFLLCTYVALYFIRPTEWVPGLIGTPIFLVVGMIACLVVFGVFFDRKRGLLKNPSAKMMVGFTLAILLSHVSHGYFGGAVRSFNYFLPSFVGFFLVLAAVDSRERFNKFIVLLIFLATFLAYEGVRQHFQGEAHGGMKAYVEHRMGADGEMEQSQRIRWYGVFNDPNDLGLALVIVIPFLLNMAMNRRYLLPAVCLPILTFGVYLTNSRGSVLAAMASLVGFFLVKYRSVKGLAASLILSVPFFVFGPSRLAQMSASESSAHGRIDAWYQGYQMFKEAPLFGVGQGMFTDFHSITAHNSFILVMSELGIFGTFFFTGIVYYPICWIWKNVFNNPHLEISKKQKNFISAIFGCMTGMLSSMFFLSRSYVLIPFMIIALASKATQLCDFEKPEMNKNIFSNKKHYFNILILSVLQVIFINFIVKIFI